MERGFCVFEEQSRQIIKQSIDEHSDALPWKDVTAFSHLVQAAMKIDYAKAPQSDFCFYDRCLCDVMAYLEKDNLTVYPSLLDDIAKHRYHQFAFIMPPWKAIFENDVERKESYEDSVEAFNQLKETYTKMGYTMIEIPKLSVEDRVDFILSEVKKFQF